MEGNSHGNVSQLQMGQHVASPVKVSIPMECLGHAVGLVLDLGITLRPALVPPLTAATTRCLTSSLSLRTSKQGQVSPVRSTLDGKEGISAIRL